MKLWRIFPGLRPRDVALLRATPPSRPGLRSEPRASASGLAVVPNLAVIVLAAALLSAQSGSRKQPCGGWSDNAGSGPVSLGTARRTVLRTGLETSPASCTGMRTSLRCPRPMRVSMRKRQFRFSRMPVSRWPVALPAACQWRAGWATFEAESLPLHNVYRIEIAEVWRRKSEATGQGGADHGR
jgi:hypothetical protein